MKKLMLAMAIFFVAFGIANADDPGDQDSLIIRITEVDTSVNEIFVWMWAVTDDSVFFYNCPLRFTPTGEGITFSHVSYFFTLLLWDEVFDSLVVSEDFLRMLGWADIGGPDNPPLLTGGDRSQILNLVFDVDDIAQDQYVFIDTCYDPINHSLKFGLIGGTGAFVPAFSPGHIKFGDPIVGIEDPIAELPTEFALKQNYPNPFNPDTKLSFDLPKAQYVTLEVYNLLGQRVKTLANGRYDAGTHTLSWNGTNNKGENVPSGIYFYSMRTEEFSKTNKMMLIR